MGSGKNGKDVQELEEKLSRILATTIAISKDNVSSRNRMSELMDMQTIQMENQTSMMSGLQTMLADTKEMSEDLKRIREAILYVFELVMRKETGGKITAQELRQSARHMENLAKGGIDALAQHNAREALNFISKIQSSGGK